MFRITFFLLYVFTLYLQTTYAEEQTNIKNENISTPIYKYIHPIQISDKKPGITGIDCIYIISPDTHLEKWQQIFSIFTQSALEINRVAGVSGEDIPEDEIRELSGPYPIRLRDTQVGSILNHLSVLHDAHKRGFNRIWVMEDDIEIVGNLQKIPNLLEELTNLDPEWDVFFTDVDARKRDGSYQISTYYNPRPDQAIPFTKYSQPKTRVSDTLVRIHQRWGSHSIILSKNGIKKIIEYFNHFYLWVPFDNDIHYIPTLREYSCTHDIVINRNKPVT